LLDHSQGHDCTKPDGQYNVGTQIKPGDIQNFWWDPESVGPNGGSISMTVEDRISTRFDRDLGANSSLSKTCKELIEDLQSKGLQPRGLLKDLQNMTIQNDISIKNNVRKIIEGWLNKSKGLL